MGIESVADENGFAACVRRWRSDGRLRRTDGMENTRQRDYCISHNKWAAERKEIGIWNHLDVVAEGNWCYPPFAMQAKNGFFLIGRASQDNKGPAVVAYYACATYGKKAAADIRVRTDSRCQEEVGMEDVMHYVQHYKVPDYILCGGLWRVFFRSARREGNLPRGTGRRKRYWGNP